MNTIVCEVKSSGPYLQSFSYTFLNDTKVNIVRHKFTNGIFERPNDFSSWKNIYEIIDMGSFELKENDVIDITNKFADSKINKPLKIGDILTEEGTSSDKYHITLDDNSKYKIFSEHFVDH